MPRSRSRRAPAGTRSSPPAAARSRATRTRRARLSPGPSSFRASGQRPDGLLLLRRLLELGRPAVDRGLLEPEAERVEVEAVALADLLERGEQLCLGLRVLERDRKRLCRLDGDVPVLLEAGRRRD